VTARSFRCRNATIAAERASCASVLSLRPESSSRALAALRAPSLAVVRRENHVTVLRLLAKAHLDAGRARNRACCRLHALARELVAGGIRKEVVVSQAETLLAGIEPAGMAQRQRLELAHELIDEIRTLDVKVKRSKARIMTAVVASATTVTDLYGVGPIVAATLIGYSGDICRFPTAGHYAAYNGTAPIEMSSAGRTVHRLSRRENRTLNHAIHMAAVTQIRKPRQRRPPLLRHESRSGQDQTRSEALVDTTRQRPRLPTTHRRHPKVGARGQSGNDSHIQRDRPTGRPHAPEDPRQPAS
jgi:transposase